MTRAIIPMPPVATVVANQLFTVGKIVIQTIATKRVLRDPAMKLFRWH